MSDRPHDGVPSSCADTTKAQPEAQHPSRTIGPYRLLQLIGEGGMGEVWLAEQAQPVRRQVALKVIKAGMDTRHVLARFDAERQALALMDHPAIATVFDGGTTPEGRPYFVMEHVKGEPITAYCDGKRLGMKERLGLFIRVCEGVQHAHQKGVIHRDLKPSNVLVTLQDGQPAPKIIDFGVAKAITQHLTERTLYTELGVMIGTPEYMSPEQAHLTGLDIDTRSDVYALGVLLYELLTGALPFDPKALREKALDEIQRTIRDVDPPKPSTRVTQMGPASTDAARNRQTGVHRLANELRGDLDWITMKCLEKDRTRRYGSASDLAADIRRHLELQPVVAGPPGALYRARKFARRHRVAVAAAGTVGALLLAFAVTLAVQARRIAAERTRAERTSAFLVSLFEASDPDASKGASLTARELLDRGVQRLAVELRDEPGTRALLLHTIGRVYFQLGLHDAAKLSLEQALPFRRSLEGRARLDLAATLNELGKVHIRLGDLDGAEAAFREVLEIRRARLGPADPDVGKALHNLGTISDRRGKLAEAEGRYRDALAILRTSDDPSAPAIPMLALARVYQRQGRLTEALAADREALELCRRTLGVEHTFTLAAMNSVGHALNETGDYAEAERIQRELLAVRRRLLGDGHFDVALARYNLGNTLNSEGRNAEAEQELRESVAIWRHTLPDPHVQTAFALNDLATVLVDERRCAEAEPLYQEALSMFRRIDGDAADAAWSLHGLGDVYRCLGRLDPAERHYRAALDLRRNRPGGADPKLADTEVALGRILDQRGAHTEAEGLLQDGLRRRLESLPATHRLVAAAQVALADCLRRQGRFEQAEELLLGAAGAASGQADALQGLVALYTAWGKPGQAAEWRARLPNAAAAATER
jgi:non-specific serine/threonine protein kinase/serine/threonine-protein kinase